MSLGRHAAALQSFEQARALYGASGMPPGAVWMARDTAECYLHLHRPADALQVLAGVEDELRHTDRTTHHFSVAARRIAAHLLLGQREAALAVLDAIGALPVVDLGEQAWLATQRAAVLLQDGAADEALVAAGRARALAGRAGMRRRAAEAALLESRALLALGRLDEATRAVSRARRASRILAAAPLLYGTHELLGQIA